jgi:hypothetical protein
MVRILMLVSMDKFNVDAADTAMCYGFMDHLNFVKYLL